MPGGEIVLLTDSPDSAREEGQKRPVIGIDCPGSVSDWSGVSYLAQSADAVDDEYAGEVWRRFNGLPLILVREEDFIIREFTEADAVRLKRLYEDPLVKRFMPSPLSDVQKDRTPSSAAEKNRPVEEWEAWIRACRKVEYASGRPSLWGICGRKDELIGIAGAGWREEEPAEGWYIGYALLPEARGRGIASKAAASLISLLFERFDEDRVYLVCERENTASAAVAKRCGMREFARDTDKVFYEYKRYKL